MLKDMIHSAQPWWGCLSSPFSCRLQLWLFFSQGEQGNIYFRVIYDVCNTELLCCNRLWCCLWNCSLISQENNMIQPHICDSVYFYIFFCLHCSYSRSWLQEKVHAPWQFKWYKLMRQAFIQWVCTHLLAYEHPLIQLITPSVCLCFRQRWSHSVSCSTRSFSCSASSATCWSSWSWCWTSAWEPSPTPSCCRWQSAIWWWPFSACPSTSSPTSWRTSSSEPPCAKLSPT